MKILLAAVNAKYIHSNLAVYSLRAYARTYRQEIEIAEYTINQVPDEILMSIYGHRPDVLCLSCYIWNIDMIGRLLPEISKVLPDTKIWLGGPEVSYDAEQVLEKYPGVSGVMCGEGEKTFLELIHYYHQKKADENLGAQESVDETVSVPESLSEIKGIACRDSSGRILLTPPRPIMDLSEVPFVYRHIEDFHNRIIYYESSRGCPFSCSYCLSSIDKCLRFRRMDLVKEELLFFLDHGVPQVKFVDRTFNCSHAHAMEIWTYIRDHDNGVTNFHFEVAADLLNEQELALIRSMRPGLIQLEIGVQSTNPQTIQEIRRKMDIGRVRQIVERLHEGRNVHCHLDLIAGLPYENYDSFANSFNEVYAMRPDQLQLGFLKVLKGSFMHENASAYGLVCQDRPPYEVLSTAWISYGEIIRLKQIEEMVEVYYNSAQFRHTMEHLEAAYHPDGSKCFANAFEMYRALADYYEDRGLSGVSHSRIDRYRILHAFIAEQNVKNEEEYREWLTYDLYLRDNVKNRPDFLGESRVTKEEASAFYRQEAQEHKVLRGYEEYDMRQIRKMTHMERIGGRLLVFDYAERDPLTQDAAVYETGL